jgi:pyrroloquinoline quinone (PQQ) biosynthesis protein C
VNMVLTTESRPLIASRVEYSYTPLACVVETPCFEHSFTGRSGELLWRTLPFLTGHRTVRQLGEQLKCDADNLVAVLNALNVDECLVADLARVTRASSGKEFVDALKDESRFMAAEIYCQPFWEILNSGTASNALILGWGIEFYHFVESANEYMAVGVASCREDARVREVLARHYIEECEHSSIFLDGLRECGLDAEQVRRAPPLASTRALINYLYETGSSNSFAYAGLFAVMQSSQDRMSEDLITAFYQHLSTCYPYAKNMFDAFRKHALIDVELEHNRIALDQIVEIVPDRVMQNSREIVRATRGLVEQFILFFEGIKDYYGRERTPLPRRRVSTELIALGA